MNFLIEYWPLLVAGIAVVVVGGYTIYVFVKKPTNEQLNSIMQWLLYAVTKAEKELGSGTGKLKLRYVYDMFISKFGSLAKVITFEMFSLMVDDALEEMRKMLSQNTAVQNYVEGITAAEQEKEEG